MVPEDQGEHQVVELLEHTGALKQGHFVLSSGLHSDRYCQCAALFEDPDSAAQVAQLMALKFSGQIEPDTVVAPALGGVVWGYELARVLGVRSLFGERTADGFSLRRGFAVRPGERVLLAEDVITTGGSVLALADLIEALGAQVVGVAAVVDRSDGAMQEKVRGRFPLWALVHLELATYAPDALPADLAAIPVEDPGSRRSLR